MWEVRFCCAAAAYDSVHEVSLQHAANGCSTSQKAIKRHVSSPQLDIRPANPEAKVPASFRQRKANSHIASSVANEPQLTPAPSHDHKKLTKKKRMEYHSLQLNHLYFVLTSNMPKPSKKPARPHARRHTNQHSSSSLRIATSAPAAHPPTHPALSTSALATLPRLDLQGESGAQRIAAHMRPQPSTTTQQKKPSTPPRNEQQCPLTLPNKPSIASIASVQNANLAA